LETTFLPPLREGGETVDQYRVEWHKEALVDEVQTVRALAPVVNEVQDIVTKADDIDEIQVVRLTGTGSGASVNEIQSFTCDAPDVQPAGGSFRIKFRGYTTDPILTSTTAAGLETILEANQAYIGDVNVSILGGQTTVCSSQAAPFPHAVLIEFIKVPGISGKMPLIETDVTQLGGNKIVNVTRATPGDAPILGSFRLSFRGHSTKDIPMDITKCSAARIGRLGLYPNGWCHC
jgi:hypothetical protein